MFLAGICDCSVIEVVLLFTLHYESKYVHKITFIFNKSDVIMCAIDSKQYTTWYVTYQQKSCIEREYL